MNKEFICLQCPIGCHLTVSLDDKGQFASVEGNGCRNGITYAKEEAVSPKRMITALIKTVGSAEKVTSVKSSKPVPKGMIFDVMEKIRLAQITAPAAIGDIVLRNVCNTGADIIVTRGVTQN